MKQNILIADSGSTKTDWAFMGERFHTQGINPFHQDDDTIRAILKDELLPNLPSSLFPQSSSLFPLTSSFNPFLWQWRKAGTRGEDAAPAEGGVPTGNGDRGA